MPVESVFSVPGRGLAVAGQIERGTIKVGEEVEIVGLNDTRIMTVAALDLFGKVSDDAMAGEYASVLLRGLRRGAIERGQMLAKPRAFTACTEFTAKARILTQEEGGRGTACCWGQEAQFHFRTAAVAGEIMYFHDVETAEPGTDVMIDVRLTRPVVMDEGQRFAIRAEGQIIAFGLVDALQR